MNDTPPITALDREAAVSTVCDDGSHFAYMMTDGILSGRMDDTLLVQAFARHRTAAERATSPAGDAGEVERLRELFAVHLAWPVDKHPRNGAPSEEWEPYYAANRARRALLEAMPELFDRLALLPQAGDADVVGEPGA